MYALPVSIYSQFAESRESREGYYHRNFDQLSNLELLAILISADDDCEDSNLHQAEIILEYVTHDLNRLAWLSLEELLTIKGLGYAKALALAAASSLLYKRTKNKSLKLYKIGNSSESFRIIKQELAGQEKESYWIFLFDGQGKFQHKHYLGKEKDSFDDHRSILQIALEQQSCSLMLVNYCNKRSAKPARSSQNNTLGLIEAANTLSMVILDHIITYAKGYYSYRDNGLID